MNNFERIKSMNIDEIAELICYKLTAKYCEYCGFQDDCDDRGYTSCKTYIRQWLECEVENEEPVLFQGKWID